MYRDLTIGGLYTSIQDTSVIIQLLEIGLEINNPRLAVSAMEELITREDMDAIANQLQAAADAGKLKRDTHIVVAIGKCLSTCPDSILKEYGKALLNGQGEEGPLKCATTKGSTSTTPEWMKEAVIESFQPHGLD